MSGVVYIGANIENEIIHLFSSCAERLDLQNSFSHGEREFRKIAIVGGYKNSSDSLNEIYPCGVYLQ